MGLMMPNVGSSGRIWEHMMINNMGISVNNHGVTTPNHMGYIQ